MLTKVPYRLPYNKDLKEKARFLRINQTNAEKKLWYQYLSPHKEKFNRQKIIDNFIVDFYCARHKLVIEIDGETHNSDRSYNYDKRRTQVLNSYGLIVIRFSNYEIYNEFDSVIERIEEYLK